MARTSSCFHQDFLQYTFLCMFVGVFFSAQIKVQTIARATDAFLSSDLVSSTHDAAL